LHIFYILALAFGQARLARVDQKMLISTLGRKASETIKNQLSQFRPMCRHS
jgi:hypothetical protein